MSIRQLMSGLVLVTALPLLILDLVLYQQLASAERRAARDRLMDSVHLLSALVDNEIDTHVAVLATLATSPALAGGDKASFAAQAKRAMAFLPGATFGLRDSEGRPVTLPDLGDPTEANPPAEQRDSVTRAFATGQPQVSDLWLGPAGEASAFVAFPVMRSDAPRQALVIGVDLARFRALIQQDVGRHQTVAIVDRKHRLLAGGPEPDLVPQSAWSQHGVAEGIQEGLVETSRPQGRAAIAFTPTRDGWTVAIGVPASEVDASVQKILWGASIAGIVLALASLGFGRFMAARMSLAMVQLVGQAQKVGRGETIRRRTFMTHEATAINEAMAAASRELVAGQAALRDSEARFRGMFENAAVGVARVALDGRWLEVNQRLCDITGYSRDELVKLTFQDITHPDDLEIDLEHVRSLVAGERPSYTLDKRYIRKDKSVVWIGLTVALERDASGAPSYFISIIRDITRRREAEDHQQFLLHELAHRSKNQLAIILAMARITSRNAGTLEAFGDQFAKRIQGLVISSELLVAQRWAGIALDALVDRQLQAFLPSPARLSMEGPEAVLAADAAEAVGLALHELATNSLKHGAWSSPSGVVAVTWRLDDGRLHMSWVERGGPPVVPPQRHGFGQDVLDRMVSQKLEGVVELRFDPEGVSWSLSIPAKFLKPA